jgi:hypothetical protein
VPLTAECKKALNLAAEESDRLAHRYIGTEHLLSISHSAVIRPRIGGLRSGVILK